MARYLGGVMDVLLFDGTNLIADAKTLTESTVSCSSDSVEVRGGQGYKLFGKYYHTATFNVTLTDAQFRLDYLALKVGSDVEYGADVFTTESIILDADGKGTVQGTPIKFEEMLVGYVHKVGSDKVQKITFDETDGKTFTFVGGEEGEEVCVKYLHTNLSAKKLIISSNFVPKTVHLVGRVQEFEDGNLIGYVNFDVPKYQLDAGFELSMSANGVSSTNLSGSALAVESATCDGTAGYYCILSEEELNRSWKDEVAEMVAIPEEIELNMSAGEVDETIICKALFDNGVLPLLIPANELNFTINAGDAGIATVDSNGKVTAVGTGQTSCEITVVDRDDVRDVVNITVLA